MTVSVNTTSQYAAGPYSRDVWDATAHTRGRIERMPFLAELAAGTLDAKAFTHYLLQDGLYLDGYARAMSLLAARAPTADDTRFWAAAAAGAIAAEQLMQGQLLATEQFAGHRAELTDDDGAAIASPTTLGYVSYLVAQAATAEYEVGVAAVLPCFWVYAHMGKVLTAEVGEAMGEHPYKTWIETYDSAEFDAAVVDAVTVFERLCEGADESTRAAMFAAFDRATVYEWHFWSAAHILEDWAAPGLG